MKLTHVALLLVALILMSTFDPNEAQRGRGRWGRGWGRGRGGWGRGRGGWGRGWGRGFGGGMFGGMFGGMGMWGYPYMMGGMGGYMGYPYMMGGYGMGYPMIGGFGYYG